MNFSFKGLSGKLVLFLMLVGLSVVTLSTYLIWQAARIKSKTRQVETTVYPAEQKLENIDRQLSDLHTSVKESGHNKDTVGYYSRSVIWTSLSADIDFLKKNGDAFSPSSRPKVDSLESLVQALKTNESWVHNWLLTNYINAPTDSVFLAERPAREQAEMIPKIDHFDKLTRRLRAYMVDLNEDEAARLQLAIDEIEQDSASATLVGVIAGFVILLLLLVGGYLIISQFKRSLQRPVEVLNKLVNGETSTYIPPTHDELGKIIEASNKLSDNLRQASDFAQHIGEGNVEYQFQPVSENDVLGNSLVQMRSKLKSINEADKKRNWITEGLGKFANIVRGNEDFAELTNIIATELVQYTQSSVGGLFVLNKEQDNDQYLELVACYAYERRKYTKKRIELGIGLVSQCYLERKTIHLKEIPQNYMLITSGLGGSKPQSLLLVPLKVNDTIEGVVEVASLREYQPHEIEFIERAGEIIASMITSGRINERTKRLLEDSQQRSEELRAQEEEMRQNLEEMQATQEQLQRQTEEMRNIQKSLEIEKVMFHTLMDYLPDRITYKDRESRITRVNKAKAKRMNLAEDEFIGKTDYDFFDAEHAAKAMAAEKELIESAVPVLNVEEKFVLSATGEIGWANSSRIPFKNDRNEVVGLFVITKDTTEYKSALASLRDREKIIEQLLNSMQVFRYTIGRQGLITNIWKSKALRDFNASAIDGKPVRDCFPEVNDLITQEGMGDSDLVCKEVMEINGEKEIFKHYLFKDSAYEGVYLGFALKQ